MTVSRNLAAVCGSASVAFFALTGVALADDKLTWSASLTGTSDYIFRGVSQTDNDPTIQGSLGVGYGIFYAGAWGSGLDFGDFPGNTAGSDAQVEIDWYAGIKPTWKHSPVGDVNFDFGVIYYSYPGAHDSSAELDYVELKAGYSFASPFIKGLTTGGTFYWSPDYTGEVGDVWTSESNASYALPKTWIFDPTISGVLGYQKGEDGAKFNGEIKDHYYYWNAGLTLTVDKLALDFRYWDTDLDKGGLCGTSLFQCDSRFVFSTTLSLP